MPAHAHYVPAYGQQARRAHQDIQEDVHLPVPLLCTSVWMFYQIERQRPWRAEEDDELASVAQRLLEEEHRQPEGDDWSSCQRSLLYQNFATITVLLMYTDVMLNALTGREQTYFSFYGDDDPIHNASPNPRQEDAFWNREDHIDATQAEKAKTERKEKFVTYNSVTNHRTTGHRSPTRRTIRVDPTQGPVGPLQREEQDEFEDDFVIIENVQIQDYVIPQFPRPRLSNLVEQDHLNQRQHVNELPPQVWHQHVRRQRFLPPPRRFLSPPRREDLPSSLRRLVPSPTPRLGPRTRVVVLPPFPQYHRDGFLNQMLNIDMVRITADLRRCFQERKEKKNWEKLQKQKVIDRVNNHRKDKLEKWLLQNIL